MNSQKIKITILTFLFIFVSLGANAGMRISNWDEKVQLTDLGRKTDLTIKAQIVDLPKNQYQSGFGIGFGTSDKMSVQSVSVDGLAGQYNFQNNTLSIRFPKPKNNNEQITINVSYSVRYNEIDQYLRHEAIYVPSWANGAMANIEVAYPWSLQSATFNKNIKEFDKQFVYRGVVPANGIGEIIKLTNVANAWEVKIKHTINVTGNIKEMTANVPLYFAGGGQKYSDYSISSNPQVPIKQEKNRNIFSFKDLNSQNVNIKIGVNIYTGQDNQIAISRNPSNYLFLSEENKNLLSSMLDQIKHDETLRDLPLYAKIGRFVHNYLQYDRSYAGRNLNLQQIVQSKRGVCVEYAKLYNALARLAGIPSTVVNGVAYGEYKHFEGHAWNLIYNNNKWIFVDPTWDLMNGIVSSSHIYFFDNNENNPDLELSWKTIPGQGNVSTPNGDNFEIKKIW